MPKGMRTTYEGDEEAPPVVLQTVKLMAKEPYSNGMIGGGAGVGWKAGEVREVEPWQYKQMMGDNPRVFEIVE